jgi:hypothetical protein
LDKKLKNPIVNFFESPSFTSMLSPLYADFFIDFAWKVCKQFVLYRLSIAGLISVRNDLTLYIAEFFCKLPEVFNIFFCFSRDTVSRDLYSVLMTAVVPVLPCTTLSQRAVPATLPFCPVVCHIPGGRTVFSCQGAKSLKRFSFSLSTYYRLLRGLLQ